MSSLSWMTCRYWKETPHPELSAQEHPNSTQQGSPADAWAPFPIPSPGSTSPQSRIISPPLSLHLLISTRAPRLCFTCQASGQSPTKRDPSNRKHPPPHQQRGWLLLSQPSQDHSYPPHPVPGIAALLQLCPVEHLLVGTSQHLTQVEKHSTGVAEGHHRLCHHPSIHRFVDCQHRSMD